MDSKCVISFSGGQDSTTLAGWAKREFKEVILVSFNYNQKHSVELEQAKIIAQKLSLPLHIIDVSFFSNLINSALIQSNNSSSVNTPHPYNSSLPASFVPNRNAFFITLIHSLAQTLRVENIALGVSEADYSGYPDCREKFIKSIQETLNLGSESNIQIHTPFIHMTKVEEFKLAQDLGILDIVILDSHTCYNGNRDILHNYGYGCDKCPACILRKNAYEEFIKIYR